MTATEPHATHPATWCHEHHPEGCLSTSVQIPGLPLTIWATGGPTSDIIQVVIDGAADGLAREVTIPIPL